MPTIPETYVFVDVETTGGNPNRDRIIEIGIWRTENGIITSHISKVIDPGCFVPSEILKLTGIKQDEIDKSPTFREISEELHEILDGAIFVAHNARFDYAFLRAEFKRIGFNWNIPTLCTVKLFRNLRPDLRKHNLDALIQEYDIECLNRHRAPDDAKVLFSLFEIGQRVHGEGFWDLVNKLLEKPYWPNKLAHIRPEQIPESPGVYIFKDEDDTPIYIGKSKNLRERVTSHFSSDNKHKELKISMMVANIDWIITAGEMSALILESSLIKKYLPIYNRMLRNKKGMIGVYETNNDGLLGIEFRDIDRVRMDDIGELIAVFKSKKIAIESLTTIAEKYKLCSKIMGLTNEKHACFWRQIEKCNGVCEEKEESWKHNARFTEAMSKIRIQKWPFKEVKIIREEYLGNESTWYVNNWCVIKHSHKDEYGNLNEQEFDPEYDWDTYKILKKFINK